ncbi:hypothetical protein [Deinococcus kurensis]|uniref:hypothetical protein n=1 Tax=Deinococcus kurensis TaxID=2662757 RepID=UPI0012D2A796|nr:hypothetical protein [Deinococcus kurensis]
MTRHRWGVISDAATIESVLTLVLGFDAFRAEILAPVWDPADDRKFLEVEMAMILLRKPQWQAWAQRRAGEGVTPTRMDLMRAALDCQLGSPGAWKC